MQKSLRFDRTPDEPSRPFLYRRDVLGGAALLGANSWSGLWLSRWIFDQEWLLAELLAARSSHALTVWVNPVPWISSDGGGDDWNGFAAERAEIAVRLDRIIAPSTSS